MPGKFLPREQGWENLPDMEGGPAPVCQRQVGRGITGQRDKVWKSPIFHSASRNLVSNMKSESVHRQNVKKVKNWPKRMLRFLLPRARPTRSRGPYSQQECLTFPRRKKNILEHDPLSYKKSFPLQCWPSRKKGGCKGDFFVAHIAKCLPRRNFVSGKVAPFCACVLCIPLALPVQTINPGSSSFPFTPWGNLLLSLRSKTVQVSPKFTFKKTHFCFFLKFTKIEQQFNDDFFPFLYFSRYEHWRFPPSNPFCFQHLYTRRRQTLFDRALSLPPPGCSNSSPKEKSAPDTKERRLRPPPKKRGPLHTQSALASNNASPPPISGTQQHPISPLYIFTRRRGGNYNPFLWACMVCVLFAKIFCLKCTVQGLHFILVLYQLQFPRGKYFGYNA